MPLQCIYEKYIGWGRVVIVLSYMQRRVFLHNIDTNTNTNTNTKTNTYTHTNGPVELHAMILWYLVFPFWVHAEAIV